MLLFVPYETGIRTKLSTTTITYYKTFFKLEEIQSYKASSSSKRCECMQIAATRAVCLFYGTMLKVALCEYRGKRGVEE